MTQPATMRWGCWPSGRQRWLTDARHDAEEGVHDVVEVVIVEALAEAVALVLDDLVQLVLASGGCAELLRWSCPALVDVLGSAA